MREWTIIGAFCLLLGGIVYAGHQGRVANQELDYCLQLLDPNVTAVPVR